MTILLVLPAACTGSPEPDASSTESTDGSDTMAGRTVDSTDADTSDAQTGAVDSSSDTDASSTGAASESSDTGVGSTGGRPGVVDCADIPAAPLSFQLLDGAAGYHGNVITADGRIIGAGNGGFIAATYDGDWEPLIPGEGGEQMDWLPGGETFAYADYGGAIARAGLDGTTEVIRSSVNAYGVVTGPDDQVWVSSSFIGIARVDPVDGELTPLLPATLGPHSIGFSPDFTRLYVGTDEAGGTSVYYVDLDPQFNPTTGLEVFATDVGGGGSDSNYIDAVVVDVCGNVYVTDTHSSNIYRLTPGGEVALFWEPEDPLLYAHALVWGTGEHGWRQDALYMAQPYNGNTVSELVVGVPSTAFDGEVLNAPAMKR